MKYSLPIEALLEKMQVDAQRPVRYFLSAQNHIIDINALIQKSVKISYTKKICLSCGKEVFRSLIQGFCYDCYQTSPMAGRNILHPEESKAHLGIEVRDLAWEKKLELQPHLVYLSITGDIKVGVTRASQAPTRWIDQGAVAAIVVAEVPNRYLAGIAEVALKALFKDKTQWQHMLKMGEIHQNLEQEKKTLYDTFASGGQKVFFRF